MKTRLFLPTNTVLKSPSIFSLHTPHVSGDGRDHPPIVDVVVGVVPMCPRKEPSVVLFPWTESDVLRICKVSRELLSSSCSPLHHHARFRDSHSLFHESAPQTRVHVGHRDPDCHQSISPGSSPSKRSWVDSVPRRLVVLSSRESLGSRVPDAPRGPPTTRLGSLLGHP